MKFATYRRDSESLLDYAWNRYYDNTTGRFLTPDPYKGSADPYNPQSWNRYAYGLNDPVLNGDPTGLDGSSGTSTGSASGTTIYYTGAVFTSDVVGSLTVGTAGSTTEDILGADAFFSPGDAYAISGTAMIVGRHAAGLGAILVLPRVPTGNNYTQAQIRALTAGLNDALFHTDQVRCGSLFASGDDDPSLAAANALEGTTYRLLAFPQGPGVGAQTLDATDVMLNTAGAFFNAGSNANGTVTVQMPSAAGAQASFTFANIQVLQGFILLHELGHQLGIFGPDLNAASNGANSQAVLEHCFTKDAQGVYH